MDRTINGTFLSVGRFYEADNKWSSLCFYYAKTFIIDVSLFTEWLFNQIQ